METKYGLFHDAVTGENIVRELTAEEIKVIEVTDLKEIEVIEVTDVVES